MESFLRAVGAAHGAECAVVYRLDRDAGVWRADHRWSGAARAPGDGFRVVGHPLTWSLREELVVQLASTELFSDRAGGWSVAGPVRAADRVLVLLFAGSPPAAAREGIRPALEHLDALHGAGLL